MHKRLDGRPVLLDEVPPGHGSAADAPSGQKEPVGQTSQAVPPGRSWKVPAMQLEHSPAAAAEKEPGLHGVDAVDPKAQ